MVKVEHRQEPNLCKHGSSWISEPFPERRREYTKGHFGNLISAS